MRRLITGSVRPTGSVQITAGGMAGRSKDGRSEVPTKTPKNEKSGQLAPVLPLRDIVVFPHMIVPLFVGREKSVRALEEVMSDDKQILLLTQKIAAEDDPNSEGLHTIGTLATVLQLLKLPDQTVRVLVEGKGRARVTGFTDARDFFQADDREVLPKSVGDAQETEALLRTVKTNFEQYIKLNKKIPAETLASVAADRGCRPSWPIRSRRICPSRSPTARRCWKPSPPSNGWKRFCR